MSATTPASHDSTTDATKSDRASNPYTAMVLAAWTVAFFCLVTTGFFQHIAPHFLADAYVLEMAAISATIFFMAVVVALIASIALIPSFARA